MQKFHILMMCHYPDLGSASDWSCYEGNLLQAIKSTSQIWEETFHLMEFLCSFLRHHHFLTWLIRQKSFNYM